MKFLKDIIHEPKEIEPIKRLENAEEVIAELLVCNGVYNQSIVKLSDNIIKAYALITEVAKSMKSLHSTMTAHNKEMIDMRAKIWNLSHAVDRLEQK
jgi:hypothetical protein